MKRSRAGKSLLLLTLEPEAAMLSEESLAKPPRFLQKMLQQGNFRVLFLLANFLLSVSPKCRIRTCLLAAPDPWISEHETTGMY